MKSSPRDKIDFLFIDGDHRTTIRDQHFPRMTCLGDYKLNRPPFVCRTICVYRSTCRGVSSVKKATIGELPEYITHRDPEVREAAKQKLEELKEV